MARNIILIEDNGGGLHMLLTDGGVCTQAASGLEQMPAGQMLEDLRGALMDGMDDWSGLSDDPQALHDDLIAAVDARNGGAKIVAEGQEGAIVAHGDNMGAAARHYAGLTETP